VNNLLVTIVIPAYNLESLVGKAIESAVNQTYRNLEILVVDDGSTDGTGAVCDEWAKKDARVRVVHQKNAGLSAVRNLGFKIAKGEYIRFLDADDEIPLESTQFMVDAFAQTNADVVSFGYSSISSDRNATRDFIPQKGILQTYDIAKHWFATSHIQGDLPFWALWVIWLPCFKRRAVLESNVLSNENLQFHEDRDFMLRYFLHSQKISYHSKLVYNYYIRDQKGNLSHTQYAYADSAAFYLDLAECFAQNKKNEQDLYVFLQDFFQPFFEELEQMIDYTHYIGKQETLGELKRIIHHPLVQKAVRLVQEKQQDKISIFCIRHKLIYLLYSHLRRKNRVQIWFAEHNLAVRSIYRDKTQALQERWTRRVHTKHLGLAKANKHIFGSSKYVLIYGAGVYGKQMLRTIQACQMEVDGFVISGTPSSDSLVDGLPVYSIGSLPFPKKETVIIVALSDKFRREVVPGLKEQGWRFYG
jgi:glycosyltransferase involved in cell wall biosynthesis